MSNPPRTPDEAAGLFEVGGETLPKETAKVPPLAGATGKCGKYRPGDRIGDFVILRLLGSGSFADVYLAQQVSLDREVAL
jgi:serine/threonine protein kinase